MNIFQKFTKKFNVKKVVCPQCQNDKIAKKTCIVCRGEGYVWVGK